MPAFDLRRSDSERYRNTLAFTWDAPKHAVIVECALFACRPAVLELGELDGVQRSGIANFDGCALAMELFEPASGVFDLTNPSIEHTLPRRDGDTLTRQDACLDVGPRRISELSVGCWAFDSSTVIAATPLEPIDPGGIYNYQEAFDLTCSDASSSRTCFVTNTSRLGGCDAGACRELCLRDEDCVAPDLVEITAADPGGAGGQSGAGASGEGGEPSRGASRTAVHGRCVKKAQLIGLCNAGGP